MKRWAKRWFALSALSLLAPAALAQSPAAPAGAPASSASTPSEPPSVGVECVEQIPAGKPRPKLEQSVPKRSLSGHALTLTFVVVHGKGETVLPSGFQPQASSRELSALERAGLYLPDPDGGAGPVLERSDQGEKSTTTVKVSFVPLPPKAGRAEILIPALPIAVARASGEMLVLCTDPAQVLIEDPIANVSQPKPRGNPPPRPQVELWTAARNAAYVALIALGVGALLSFLIGRWLRRPKPLPPAPPPRPPWEIALEELFDLRHAGLLGEQRYAEYYDRVSDTMRKYLGARYGFDGLESTTREAMRELRRVTPRIGVLDVTEAFLRDADLVKFARVTPSEADCALSLSRAEEIVRATMPAPVATPPNAGPNPPSPPSPEVEASAP